MNSRPSFHHEPVSHSVAHHLVAIAELLEEYGYARVSDVARRLGITRGSASITLKSLKQKGLVTEDDRRFLGLSDAGRQIAESVRAKKAVMKDLLVRFLGVDEEQAEQDTCKFEHLISSTTAERATRLMSFYDEGGREVKAFRKAFESFVEIPDGETDEPPAKKKSAKKKRGS